MRTWQVERRKRTRHLIELGGLIVKAGVVELTADDRATIYGALLWIASKLQSTEGEHARDLWAAKGRQAFDAEWHENEKISDPSGSCATPQSQGRCPERD
ncbi:conjugal transfer protein TraD [Mesorhizobium opportunistum]|uniref:Conjugal transfer protein TraD n=1 Tax=Mesorhizobium opportunistum TaxID=593909 RepID=A0ABV1YA96_9HYPH